MPYKIPKILAPAGNLTCLRAAINAGCDEIYFGMKGLNMRANAVNFSVSDIKKVVAICHKHNVKAFLAINTIVYENELVKVEKAIKAAKKANADAIIAWDMAVVELCNKHNISVHLSTQASVSNHNAFLFYHNNIKRLERIILARECSLSDIRRIMRFIKSKRLNVEIETFVHGAMCVSVSGRCFLSQELFGRSANRGDCLQPCRRNFKAYEIKDVEEKHMLELGEDYVLSPKDLCAMPFIEKLIAAGINAFKIEGRNRSPEYVKCVVSCYRKVLDYYAKNRAKMVRYPAERAKFEKLKKEFVNEMMKVYNRKFSSGFFLGKPVDEWSNAYGSKAETRKVYAGKVLNYYSKIGVAEIKLESAGLKLGDKIMIQGPTTGVIEQELKEMQIEGRKVKKAVKGSRAGIKINDKVRVNDKVYIIVDKRKQ